MTIIKIISPKNKTNPLIKACQLLNITHTLDKNALAQGVFIYSNEEPAYLPLEHFYMITENPKYKNTSKDHIFYTDAIDSPLFPSLFCAYFLKKKAIAFKEFSAEEKAPPKSFMIKESISNFYYPQNKLLIHSLSHTNSCLSIGKYTADYFSKKNYNIHLYTSTPTSFEKKNIKLFSEIHTLTTIYKKKHLHIFDTKKESPLSSYFEDSKRLLIIHNHLNEIDWLEKNRENLHHTALLFVKFTLLKRTALRKNFKELPSFFLTHSNKLPKLFFQWIEDNLHPNF